MNRSREANWPAGLDCRRSSRAKRDGPPYRFEDQIAKNTIAATTTAPAATTTHIGSEITIIFASMA